MQRNPLPSVHSARRAVSDSRLKISFREGGRDDVQRSVCGRFQGQKPARSLGDILRIRFDGRPLCCKRIVPGNGADFWGKSAVLPSICLSQSCQDSHSSSSRSNNRVRWRLSVSFEFPRGWIWGSSRSRDMAGRESATLTTHTIPFYFIVRGIGLLMRSPSPIEHNAASKVPLPSVAPSYRS